MSRWGACAWATIAVGLLAVSCGSGAEGGGPTTTDSAVDAPVSIAPVEPVTPIGPPGSIPTSVRTGANPPDITGFTAPATVPCAAGERAAVAVTYETAKAMTVMFADGAETILGAPPLSGGYSVPVTCDGKEHNIVLIAVGDDGSTSAERKPVMVGGA